MRVLTSWPAACVMLVVALAPSSVLGQQTESCLVVENDKTAPVRKSVAALASGAREVDVKQVVRLTSAGMKSLGNLPLAYVKVVRVEPVTDGSAQPSFVRLFEESPADPIGGERSLETHFSFSRKGDYALFVYGAPAFSWPLPPTIDSGDPLCPPTHVNVVELTPEERPDFPGVRGQWWGTYRVPTTVELGASVFVRRIGVAATAALDPTHLGSRSNPENVNPVTAAIDVRYRGARGYVGGGVRYYPDEEPDRDQLRLIVVAGEELPSFKGRPMWLLLGLRLEQLQKNFLSELRLEFAFRFDLWGSRP